MVSKEKQNYKAEKDNGIRNAIFFTIGFIVIISIPSILAIIFG